jgi:hypothetical protein
LCVISGKRCQRASGPKTARRVAGLVPLNLNNEFITSPDPASLVAEAEHRGFPMNSCVWIKGLYATARRLGAWNFAKRYIEYWHLRPILGAERARARVAVRGNRLP